MDTSITESEPNLVGFRINHRTMRADTRRLADLAERVADGRIAYDLRRGKALRTYVRLLCDGIHHHHRMEDEVLWPVLTRSAATEVELRDLSDDHASLDPVLDETRGAVDGLVAVLTPGGPEQRVRSAAGRLATVLAQLRDLLDEHIEEEERLIFPVIRRYVSVADWTTVERAVRKGGALRFELPRIERYARPEELAELKRIAGPVLRLMLAALRPGFRRREATVFGG
ncbi:hemerythrin domain-containing protein [Micromonospora mirobrigensis]|uniref:Hemerythrin HHE cation binding domain-containing protein n=1 Tax=Micromonospora mirobrigensis TaxID=262898 RepID=A0A1C4WDE2_9ACTN|nr:hemerythrin domain-containing protein [Micromonospora mirobrigensis]SCE94184.1 Hemerythrin HHE cation binding domain-containing protein [Micromonospora mirobrigensis]